MNFDGADFFKLKRAEMDNLRGRRVGFVVMPDHVHAIVWFPARDQLSLHAITPPGLPLAAALRTAPENLAAAVGRAF